MDIQHGHRTILIRRLSSKKQAHSFANQKLIQDTKLVQRFGLNVVEEREFGRIGRNHNRKQILRREAEALITFINAIRKEAPVDEANPDTYLAYSDFTRVGGWNDEGEWFTHRLRTECSTVIVLAVGEDGKPDIWDMTDPATKRRVSAMFDKLQEESRTKSQRMQTAHLTRATDKQVWTRPPFGYDSVYIDEGTNLCRYRVVVLNKRTKERPDVRSNRIPFFLRDLAKITYADDGKTIVHRELFCDELVEYASGKWSVRPAQVPVPTNGGAYRKDFAINDEEAEKIRRVGNEASSPGNFKTDRQIRTLLNSEGIFPYPDLKWADHMVRCILAKEIYVGRLQLGAGTRETVGPRIITERFAIDRPDLAILPMPQRAEIVRHRTKPPRPKRTRNRYPELRDKYWLKGSLLCGTSNTPMTIRGYGEEVFCPDCGTAIKSEVVVQLVVRKIMSVLEGLDGSEEIDGTRQRTLFPYEWWVRLAAFAKEYRDERVGPYIDALEGWLQVGGPDFDKSQQAKALLQAGTSWGAYHFHRLTKFAMLSYKRRVATENEEDRQETEALLRHLSRQLHSAPPLDGKDELREIIAYCCDKRDMNKKARLAEIETGLDKLHLDRKEAPKALKSRIDDDVIKLDGEKDGLLAELRNSPLFEYDERVCAETELYNELKTLKDKFATSTGEVRRKIVERLFDPIVVYLDKTRSARQSKLTGMEMVSKLPGIENIRIGEEECNAMWLSMHQRLGQKAAMAERCKELLPIIGPLREKGFSWKTIAKYLNDKGLLPPGGRRWRAASILRGIKLLLPQSLPRSGSRLKDNWETVRAVVQKLREEGANWPRIAKHLNEAGYRTVTGKLWRSANLRLIVGICRKEAA